MSFPYRWEKKYDPMFIGVSESAFIRFFWEVFASHYSGKDYFSAEVKSADDCLKFFADVAAECDIGKWGRYSPPKMWREGEFIIVR